MKKLKGKIKGMRWVVLCLIVLVTILNILERGTLNYLWKDEVNKTNGAVVQQGIIKLNPGVVETSSSFTFKSIINASHTDCFAVNELMLDGEKALKGNGDFFCDSCLLW